MGFLWGTTPEQDQFSVALGSSLLGGQNVQQQLGNIGPAVAPVLAQQAQNKQAAQVKQSTLQMLQGTDQDLAQAVEAGAMTPADAVKMSFERKMKAEQPRRPNIISVGNGMLYDMDNKSYITPPEGTATDTNEYGLNPIWVRDPTTGTQKLMVTSKDGTTKILDTQGNDPISPLKAIDTGTGTMLVDPRTATPNTTIEKDVAGQKEQEKIGGEIGAIKMALPSARVTAKMVATDIKDLSEDPALANALGPVDTRVPTWREDTARVESKIKKLVGQSFLQAREMLRGGGQITDYEGQRAEAAMARLNAAQSPEDFKVALKEYNDAVQEGLNKLEAIAGGNLDYGKQPADGVNPRVESLIEKYRTK